MTKIRRKFTLTKLRSQIGWKVAFLRPPWHLKSLFFTDFRDFKLQYLREHTFYYSLSMSDTWGNIQGTSWYDRNDLSTPTAKVIWKNTFFCQFTLNGRSVPKRLRECEEFKKVNALLRLPCSTNLVPPLNFTGLSWTGLLWRCFYENEFLGQVQFRGGD